VNNEAGMLEFQLTNGVGGTINQVATYIEVKLIQSPSLQLTSDLCRIRQVLLESNCADHIMVTLDALSFVTKVDPEVVKTIIESIAFTQTISKSKHVIIEVNYNGRDLPSLCEKLNLTRQEIIGLHTSGQYYVAMMGFLPGFPYIGGLPKEIQLPRKLQADKVVPQGAVAIAMEYTGIYPQQSPGGWHIIGHTTFKNFNPMKASKFQLSLGDTIRFKSLGI
jgi:KipI family sensor histidine kinase inhibitor